MEDDATNSMIEALVEADLQPSQLDQYQPVNQ
jgi:hypothetical protein